MRELEFRAWVYYGEKLEKPHYSRDYDSLSRFFEDHDENDDKQCIEQYTGLKDKNGKEIYEGDIVHIKFVGVEPEIWVIGWDISLCRFGYFHSYKRILDGHWSDKDLKAIDYRRQPLEVIGNIHENPELIGKEKE